MDEIKIILDGAVGHDDDNDWLAGELGITKEMIPDLSMYQGKKLPEFNQGKRIETKLACTIVNAYREYCYQTNHEFTEQELLDIVEFARTLGYSGGGWVSHGGMEAVRKYFNNGICFVKVENNNPLLGEIYIKRNALGITYKGNDRWNVDSDDGVLDGTTFGTTTYGHRTSTIFYDKAIVVHDSYVGTKGNIYELPAKNINSLVRNGYIYPTFYLWIPLKNVGRISELNKMKVNCQKRIDIAKELKTQTQDINYVKYLNDSILKDESKLSDVLKQLKLLQK